ncbi:MAG: glycosyltransferase [Verrucomicrobia bacterium]|nr:glycosyltransferase [Verrucomicrobiota bacterium]
MKVLQIVDCLGMGGAETWLMEVLRLWTKSGRGQMDFLLTSGNKGIFDDEAAVLGANLHYVKYGKRSLLQFRREFRQILKNGDYMAVHDHQDYASGWHFLLGAGVLPPVRVTHVHNPSYQIHHNYGVSASRRLTARLGKFFVSRFATHIAGTSQQMISEYGLDAPAFKHIPSAALHCGFDPARFAGDQPSASASVRSEFGWSPDAKVILFAGRIDQSADPNHPQNHKNSAFAVDVGIAVAQHDPSVCMLLAGQPNGATSILEDRIQSAGLTNRIQFIGIRHDIDRLMLGCDALLFPSRGEGLGMVAVEAQAAGLPVLASDAVPKECVVSPELVTFLPLNGDAKLWATELIRLLQLPRDASGGNEAVKNSPFALNHSAEAMFKLYSGRSFA